MGKSKKGLLPSGQYRYRLYLGKDPAGKRMYKSFTADSLAAAKKLAKKWEDDHPTKPSKDPTFREAADMFLANRSNALSGSTYGDYVNRVNYLCELFPIFASYRMSQIDSEIVQDIVNQLIKTKKECRKKNPTAEDLEKQPYISAKTVMNYYSIITSVLRTQGQINIHDIKLPDLPEQQLVIPEEEDIKKLFGLIKGTELELPVLLGALGPMRKGEIFGLDINTDVDYINHSVHVHRDYIYCSSDRTYRYKETPKTSAGNRTIIYPAYVTDLIKQKGYITTLGFNYLIKKYQRTLVNAGLTKYRFHDLRHYSASFQIALGIPPQYVMDRGGWESDYSMKRYIHALDQKRKEFSTQANDAFSESLAIECTTECTTDAEKC